MTANHVDAPVVVIGAGIIGCSAAYFLAKSGLPPVVLDAGGVSGQASGVNAGTLAVQNKTGLLLQIAMAGVALWKELTGEAGLQADYVQSGGLRVAMDDDEAAELERQVEEQREIGLPLELLSPAQVRDRFSEPFGDLKAAAFCPVDGYANPRLAVRSLANLAREAGARLLPFTAVTALEALGDSRIHVRATSRDGQSWVFDSAYVVNAAGVWSSDIAALLGYSIPLILKVQQAMVTVKTARIIHRTITHVGERLSVKQMRDGNILIGGGWPGRTDAAKKDRDILYESVIDNLRLAAQVLPILKQLQLLRVWCGLEAETADRVPVIGALGAPANFLSAVSGFGGFTVGPLVGKLVAEQILTGRRTELAALCDPLRLQNAV